MCPLRFLICLYVLVVFIAKINAKFEFTNLQCTALDKNYIDIEYCFLKSVNRTYKYASLKFQMKSIPVKVLMINLVLMKRLNGYKPFLYNITVDGCKVLANPKAYPVANYFYEFVQPFSNLNHSCPYKHDLIVDKVPIEFVNYRLTKILPFPEGDYLIEASWLVKGISRFVLKIFGTLS